MKLSMSFEKHAIDKEFDEALAGCASIFTKPYICTATVVCSLIGDDKINIDMIRENKNLTIRQVKKKKAKKEYRPFFNAVTCVFDNTKTIKVFKNGKLHITGCTTLAHSLNITKRLIDTMNWSETTVKNIKILTLNTSLSLSPKILLSLEKLENILASYKDVYVKYNPDIYQGLILKALCSKTNRNITILCFYTSSFIITGITEPYELQFALSFLNQFITENINKITLDSRSVIKL